MFFYVYVCVIFFYHQKSSWWEENGGYQKIKKNEENLNAKVFLKKKTIKEDTKIMHLIKHLAID